VSRFEMDGLDRVTVERARKALADRDDVAYLDMVAMARRIGRLEAVVDSLVEMVDRATGEDERAARFVERHFPIVSGFLAGERGEDT
jgi:hypothetical protein